MSHILFVVDEVRFDLRNRLERGRTSILDQSEVFMVSDLQMKGIRSRKSQDRRRAESRLGNYERRQFSVIIPFLNSLEFFVTC